MNALLLLAQETAESLAVESSRLKAQTLWLFGVVLGVLGIAYAVGRVMRRRPEGSINVAVLRTFNLRIRAWWMMCAILMFGFILRWPSATVFLFFLVSFWALREFVTMTPTRRGDHRALFWVFFVFTPVQYLLVAIGRSFVTMDGDWTAWAGRSLGLTGVDFYGLYSIMIPVYASLFIPARIAISGDHKRFLERSAKIQAGLLICVYSLSYAPALLHLELVDYQNHIWTGKVGDNESVLFFFVLTVQLGDVFQYGWGKLLGRRVIAPAINASRTWEGFFGGIATTTLVGALLWWATPFRIWEAACMSMVIAVMGFAGSMTMSAIKRDRGVEDYGTLVQGHPGVLDRIDSICFAAPVFYHLTRYFFSTSV